MATINGVDTNIFGQVLIVKCPKGSTGSVCPTLDRSTFQARGGGAWTPPDEHLEEMLVRQDRGQVTG